MRRLLLVFAVLLPVILVMGILFWYFAIYQKPTETFPSAKPTPGVGFGSLNPYTKLCLEFRKTESKISCEYAVKIALEHSPGKIRKISTGPVRTTILSESGSPERRTVDMWLVDIALTKPYFDDNFNKLINVLQIGIRRDEHNLIYQKPIR